MADIPISSTMAGTGVMAGSLTVEWKLAVSLTGSGALAGQIDLQPVLIVSMAGTGAMTPDITTYPAPGPVFTHPYDILKTRLFTQIYEVSIPGKAVTGRMKINWFMVMYSGTYEEYTLTDERNVAIIKPDGTFLLQLYDITTTQMNALVVGRRVRVSHFSDPVDVLEGTITDNDGDEDAFSVDGDVESGVRAIDIGVCYSNYAVMLNDVCLVSNRFHNIKVTQKFQQIWTFTGTFFNLTPYMESLMTQGVRLRCLLDDIVIFSGKIRQATPNENKTLWDVDAESWAADARAIVMDIEDNFYETPAADLLYEVCPGDWSLDLPEDSGAVLDYKRAAGNSLMHMNNICLLTGWEWEVIEETFTAIIAGAVGGSIGVNTELVPHRYQGNNAIIVSDNPPASSSALSATITSTATTLTLTDASDFPSSGAILIGGEKISYTGKNGNQLTGLSRGVEGTTAAFHVKDSVVGGWDASDEIGTKYRSFIVQDNSDFEVTVADAGEGLNTGDRMFLFGPIIFRARTFIGNGTSKKTFQVNKSIYNVKRGKDLDRLFTAVTVKGVEAEIPSGFTRAAADVVHTGILISSESRLAENITKTQTVFAVENGSGYMNLYPGTIIIESEKMKLVGVSGDSLTVTREWSGMSSSLDSGIDASQNYLTLVNGGSFPASNGILKIESEYITYTTRTGNNFTGCTRGALGSSAAAHSSGKNTKGYTSSSEIANYHHIGDDVLMLSALEIEGLNDDWYGVSVRIGNEVISAESVEGNKIINLTRGGGSYAHKTGTLVSDNPTTKPEEDTPVYDYGLYETSRDGLGCLSLDSLDKMAGQILLMTQNMPEGGTANYTYPNFYEDLKTGDTITIIDEDGIVSREYRLMGMVWRWMQVLEFSFGVNEEYIAETFSEIPRMKTVGMQKNENAGIGPVTEVSASGKFVKVLKENGIQEWMRILK